MVENCPARHLAQVREYCPCWNAAVYSLSRIEKPTQLILKQICRYQNSDFQNDARILLTWESRRRVIIF